MKIETISFHGWPHTQRIFNDEAELIVTTDVGPRILGYRTFSSENVFHVVSDQLGKSGEEHWQMRGGHRFWLAPEDLTLSYHVDNQPANYRQDEASHEFLIETLQRKPQDIRKTLGIRLDDKGSRVTIRHSATNLGEHPIPLATWALSVMQPGGLEIIPQPPLGEHPRDLLPNRGMVLWPYTDLSDPRLTFGQRFWLLRQSAGYPPTKLGLAHRANWIAYVLNDTLFIKTFAFENGANYPDGGCNFETFTNSEMLEIESLGPLVTLAPDQSATHVENWYLFHLTEQAQIESEEALAEWMAPFLARIRPS